MSDVPPPPPPPPPTGGGTPGPAGGASASGFDIGNALSWAWNKFTQNASTWILATLAILVAVFVAVVIYFVLLAVVGDSLFLSLLVVAVFTVALIALTYGAAYGLVRGALQQSRGETPTFQTMFDFSQFGPYFLAVLVQGLIVGVGALLCYIPGIIAAVLLAFVPFYAADRQLSVGDCLRASYELVTKNLGPAILFLIVAYVVYAIGSAICGIGIIVSAPVALLMMAHGYRSANGEPVAA